MMKYKIYGAGDNGTNELRHILTEHQIPHSFVDIRCRPTRKESDPIAFLVSHRLQTVPQVFLGDVLIGTFEAMLKHLDISNKAAA
jgi:hypothetical protein